MIDYYFDMNLRSLSFEWFEFINDWQEISGSHSQSLSHLSNILFIVQNVNNELLTNIRKQRICSKISKTQCKIPIEWSVCAHDLIIYIKCVWYGAIVSLISGLSLLFSCSACTLYVLITGLVAYHLCLHTATFVLQLSFIRLKINLRKNEYKKWDTTIQVTNNRHFDYITTFTLYFNNFTVIFTAHTRAHT